MSSHSQEEPQKIVLATTNPGKIRDYQDLFKDFSVQIIAQSELGVPEIPETGFSFVENALIKARNACRVTGLPALGDDGGLCIDALGGEPGLYSARYAGEKATAEQNYQKVLRELSKKEGASRKAQFYIVIVYLRSADDPMPIIAEGTWAVEVMEAPKGDLGFGYLPVMWVPTHHCSAAELPVEERNRINHRGMAFRKLVERLRREASLQKHLV